MGERALVTSKVLWLVVLLGTATAIGCTGDTEVRGEPAGAATGAALMAYSSSGGAFSVVELDRQGKPASIHTAPNIGLGYRVSPDGKALVWINASGPDGPIIGTLDLESGTATSAPTVASAVDYLPDGRMVGLDLSSAQAGIGILAADGRFTLTGRLQHPAASPRRVSETEVIVFEREELPDITVAGGSPVIVSLDGSLRRPLTLPDGCFAVGGSAAPDGTKVAVSAMCANSDRNGLYLIRTDDQSRALLVQGDLLNAAWSPDGSSIAYLASDGNGEPAASLADFADIVAGTVWVADASTGSTRQATPDGEIYLSPNWRPTPG